MLSAEPEQGSLARIFEEMENCWAQGHHVRALGAYLVDVAIATAVSTRVTRSFGITVGSGDEAQVFVLGK